MNDIKQEATGQTVPTHFVLVWTIGAIINETPKRTNRYKKVMSYQGLAHTAIKYGSREQKVHNHAKNPWKKLRSTIKI